jgi:hypothetical protein
MVCILAGKLLHFHIGSLEALSCLIRGERWTVNGESAAQSAPSARQALGFDFTIQKFTITDEALSGMALFAEQR